MSSNQNLHAMNKLTEFARDFEEEPETLFGRFVNKLQTAYNQSYNTVNDLSSVNPQSPTSSTSNSKSVFYADANLHSDNSSTIVRDSSSSSISTNTIYQSTSELSKVNNETMATKEYDSNSTEKTDTSSLPIDGQEGRTMVNVLKRIRTMMASKNNVCNKFIILGNILFNIFC